MLQLVAIRPTRAPLGDPRASLDALLGSSGFAGEVIRRLADYPPQTISGQRQSLGVRYGNRAPRRAVINRGYRRTGTLGRGWRLTFLGARGADAVSEVTNRVPYSVYVEGPADGSAPGTRQTAVMAEKGWPNVTEVAQQAWALYQPRIVRVLTQQEGTTRPAL